MNYQKRGRPIEGDWLEKILEIKRTSKKTKGGNQIAFTVLVVVGDRKGKVGFALARAKNVPSAIKKAMKKARKAVIQLPLVNQALPHPFTSKFKGAKVFLRPGRAGAGLIAGSVIRSIAQVAGIDNLTAKVMGSSNKNANIQAVFKGFKALRE
ncbi:30S ribosomal protein S5 [Candidatus Shapirobacteria bacterium]|nr:30S ribosomal protein S5 [Candidatus Shapirobacteria bacterium]